MFWTIFGIIVGLLALLILVLVIRALAFKPKGEPLPEPMAVEFDREKAIEHFVEMIRCKTVSSHNPELQDEKEFEKFRDLLKATYPHVHKECPPQRIGPSGLLFHWKGKSDKEPSVLMSHYDVVTADEASWQKPPFAGVIEDGVLWGRGTLDTKGTLLGVMESVEAAIKKGFVPQNDVYLSFAGDEEIAGSSAPMIVDELEKRGIRPALVVDEGGAVVENIFPGVSTPCALIGVGEKGLMEIELKVKSTGGHASAPPKHGPLGKVAQAVVDVENHPFPGRLTPPVAGMFDTLGRHSSFLFRLVFANQWLFLPLLKKMGTRLGDEFNAMLRTTCAFTMAEASDATNVLPPHAKVIANMRLVGGDTPDSAIQYIKDTVKNPEVEVTMLNGMNPSIFSDTSSAGYAKLKKAILQTWGDVLVSPYLMIACSDSRHFCRISDKVMRFSAMALSKEERGLIHGHNERIPTEKALTTIEFYIRLVSQL